MRPFFPFYGSKWLLARHFEPPRARALEPFCGAAGYATYWEPETVVLADIDPIICGVWDYLIGASEREILALPDLAEGQSTDDLPHSQEARWLIGFWINRGSAQPKKTQSAYSRRSDRAQLNWSPRARERIAGQLHAIRGWHILNQPWEVTLSLAGESTTTFVDPPYANMGTHYRHHAIDWPALAARLPTVPGRVICCEQDGADALDFAFLRDIKATRGRSREVVWYGGGA